MKVLLLARRDLLVFPAGDTIQIQRTEEVLKDLGVTVKISLGPPQDLEEWDLVHLFNLMRIDEVRQLAGMEPFLWARRPLVVTPFYWNRQGEAGYDERIWLQQNSWRRFLLQEARAILVSGLKEKELLERDFGNSAKIHIVPVGVQAGFFLPDPAPFYRAHGLEGFVFMAARISREKNQLALLRAMRGIPLPLVLAGPINDPFYLEQCFREGQNKVFYLGHLPLAELAGAYAAARVHALPSRYEIPGLTSLEAAAAGCNVISTREGTAWEYLGDEAWYCEPGNLESIRAALEKALAAPKSQSLAERVHREFTWAEAGTRTLDVYHRVLGDC